MDTLHDYSSSSDEDSSTTTISSFSSSSSLSPPPPTLVTKKRPLPSSTDLFPTLPPPPQPKKKGLWPVHLFFHIPSPSSTLFANIFINPTPSTSAIAATATATATATANKWHLTPHENLHLSISSSPLIPSSSLKTLKSQLTATLTIHRPLKTIQFAPNNLTILPNPLNSKLYLILPITGDIIYPTDVFTSLKGLSEKVGVVLEKFVGGGKGEYFEEPIFHVSLGWIEGGLVDCERAESNGKGNGKDTESNENEQHKKKHVKDKEPVKLYTKAALLAGLKPLLNEDCDGITVDLSVVTVAFGGVSLNAVDSGDGGKVDDHHDDASDGCHSENEDNGKKRRKKRKTKKKKPNDCCDIFDVTLSGS